MNLRKIKCGQCNSEWELPTPNGNDVGNVSCPLCGYSKSEVKESVAKSKQKVLKG
jgi:Zn ribbon nucleic-acid-binding protein